MSQRCNAKDEYVGLGVCGCVGGRGLSGAMQQKSEWQWPLAENSAQSHTAMKSE